MPIAHYLFLLLPQILLAMTGVLCLIAEMFHKPKLGLMTALAGYGAVVGTAISLLGTDEAVFMGTYLINDLSLWANIILVPATAACLLLWRERFRGVIREGTGYALFSFAALGAIMLAGAGDLMFLVLGVLLSGVASFALVGFRQSPLSTEAAMKYFVYASVTGAVMLFGLTYWYGITGSTLFSEQGSLSTMPVLALIGLVGVIVGLGYQAAAVPVHQWTPDTYQGTNIPVAAFLSVVTKTGAIFALAQLAAYLPDSIAWRPAIAVVAAATILLGTIAALPQQNVVRLLAYSSIAQTGYFLLAVAVIGRDQTAVQALIVFAAAYAAMNIGAFAVTMQQGKALTDFTGALQTHRWRAIAMIVFLLSLIGIPPLAGFIGKLLLFGSAIAGSYIWLAVIGILGSVIALGAYWRIVGAMIQTGKYTVPPESSNHYALSSLVWVTALVLTISLGIGGQLFY
jgi:proton-translocating NADH-quinone oxidoreductase chain N